MMSLLYRDFNGNSYSSIVDSLLTMTMGDNMAKVVSWYDNEWAYSVSLLNCQLYCVKAGRRRLI